MHTDTDTERDRDRSPDPAEGPSNRPCWKPIRQAEAKATSLLGLFAVTLAAALVLLTRTDRISPFAAVVLSVATAPLLGSMLALLSVLYGRFEWAANGEVFNGRGKTDIQLAFVAGHAIRINLPEQNGRLSR